MHRSHTHATHRTVTDRVVSRRPRSASASARARSPHPSHRSRLTVYPPSLACTSPNHRVTTQEYQHTRPIDVTHSSDPSRQRHRPPPARAPRPRTRRRPERVISRRHARPSPSLGRALLSRAHRERPARRHHLGAIGGAPTVFVETLLRRLPAMWERVRERPLRPDRSRRSRRDRGETIQSDSRQGDRAALASHR